MDHPAILPSEFFHIPEGLREGSKLPPLLFNLAVNDVSQVVTIQKNTAPRSDHRAYDLNSLGSVWQYADDVAILASLRKELATLLSKLDKYCYQRGLTINFAKSCIMEVTPDTFRPGRSFSLQTLGSGTHASIPIVDTLTLTLTLTLFLFQQPQSSCLICDTFDYLGIPITRTLDSATVLSRCLSRFWAAWVLLLCVVSSSVLGNAATL